LFGRKRDEVLREREGLTAFQEAEKTSKISAMRGGRGGKKLVRAA